MQYKEICRCTKHCVYITLTSQFRFWVTILCVARLRLTVHTIRPRTFPGPEPPPTPTLTGARTPLTPLTNGRLGCTKKE